MTLTVGYLIFQARTLMSQMGVRRFQDLIGRTDKLKFCPNPNNPKARLLDFSAILKNALDGKPETNIVGGSVAQDFELGKKLVSLKLNLSIDHYNYVTSLPSMI